MNSNVLGTVLDILHCRCCPNPGQTALLHFADEQIEFWKGPAHNLEVAEPILKPGVSKHHLLRRKPLCVPRISPVKFGRQNRPKHGAPQLLSFSP